MKAVHAYVSGQVQGVFYRQTCRQIARRHLLLGWVRNLGDGRVEVWAQGDETELEAFVRWLWSGPQRAEVTGVESHDVEPDQTLQDFLIVG